MIRKSKNDTLDWLEKIFRRHRGFFISGTDTGVGKTYVACLLAGQLRDRGLSVNVMKPAESGAGKDAERLKRASGCKASLEEIRPFYFKAPLAPVLAAEREGKKISLKKIYDGAKPLGLQGDGVLVEGAGGLLVPLSGKKMMVDLAAELGLPLILVARAGLGTINHTLLSIFEARRRGVRVAAVILNGKTRNMDVSRLSNPEIIMRYGQLPVLGPLPWGARNLNKIQWTTPR